jgi:hypothetical protein
MGCCGEKRAKYRRQIARSVAVPAQRPAAPPPEPVAADAGTVVVSYRGARPVALRGAATRTVYTFSAARRTRAVAETDATVLLASALFERVDR